MVYSRTGVSNNFQAHPVGLIDLDHTKAEISKDDSKRFTLSTDSTNTDKNKVPMILFMLRIRIIF